MSHTDPQQTGPTEHDSHAKVSYHLDFARFYEHIVDITVRFEATTDAPTLWLPAWIPGSYLMREFARNITSVQYHSESDTEDKQNKPKRAQKIDKHTWQLPTIKAGECVCVCYEVYCYDLSVRTAYVDQERLYGNFTSLTLAIAGQEAQPIQVTLLVPSAFVQQAAVADKALHLACGLPATHIHSDARHAYQLHAPDYDTLLDNPFELAYQDRFDFIVQDDSHQTLAHHFYLSGTHHANLGRLQQDVMRICQGYVNWLGDAPFSDYTFMTYASGQDYGGLEHINSTSLITPRADLPSANEPELPSEEYQRFLGLCSHEYFHAWWVKTVRPDVMLNVDLRQEAFTPLLWVFEGFTSYIDDFMLQASGVIDKDSYLKLLTGQISRYYQTAGRQYQSVAESSFDAWIKLYRSDENTANAGISYYNKGALVALCLDLTLLKESGGRYRLFDVVKAFYARAKANDNQRIGMHSADMGDVVAQFMPRTVWDDFERRYVNGVEELPLAELLSDQGIELRLDDSKQHSDAPFGMRYSAGQAGLVINRVLRGSAAAKAGISAKDVLIAVDGIKADGKALGKLAAAQVDTPIRCHLFRRDVMLTVNILPNGAKDANGEHDANTDNVWQHVSLHHASDNDNDNDKAEKPWQTWLGALNNTPNTAAK